MSSFKLCMVSFLHMIHKNSIWSISVFFVCLSSLSAQVNPGHYLLGSSLFDPICWKFTLEDNNPALNKFVWMYFNPFRSGGLLTFTSAETAFMIPATSNFVNRQSYQYYINIEPYLDLLLFIWSSNPILSGISTIVRMGV